MKLTVAILLICCLQVSANVASQTVSYSGKNVPLQTVLTSIEKQTGYTVAGDIRALKESSHVNIEARNESLPVFLDRLLRNTDIQYAIRKKTIFISRKRGNIDQVKANEVPQQILLLVEEIHGRVTDSTGAPLAGASVRVKGTNTGTNTNANGEFTIDAGKTDILIISFVGYRTVEISANSSTLMIRLFPLENQMEDMVVVGYGTQKKVNLTGAVSTVDAKALQERPVANAVQALQGVVPGLNIFNAGNGGELNGTKSINIRGVGTIGTGSNSSPLILIDGMEGNLNNINPQDIDNISVLKDAAASSIYGSRAPFGVILVTTKSGKQGRAVINYNNNFRFNTPVLMPKMQNSWEFVNYFNDGQFNGTNTYLFPADNLKKVKDYFDGVTDPRIAIDAGAGDRWNNDLSYGNVDWVKQYYKKWSPSQEHNLGASGDNEKTSYYLSSNFMGQDGFMRYGTEDYNRYTITAKISSRLNNYLKVDYSGRYIRTDYGRPSNMDDDFYNHILRRARPTRPILDPNGFSNADANYILTMTEGGRRNEQNDNLYQQIRTTLTLLPGWNIIGEVNLRTEENWTHEDRKRVYSHNAANPENTYVASTSPLNDFVFENAYRSTYINTNLYTNYEKSFGSHNFKTMLGFQSESLKNRLLSAQRNGIISYDIPVLNGTTDNASAILRGEYNNWATAGFFGRLNYDYEGKYLAEANLRYDGTSRFRSDNRWIWTPSVSVGWNISKENFFEPLSSYVNLLKIRASYGVLANQNTSNWYPTYQTIPTGTANGLWLINGLRPNTSSVPGLVSSSLTWEEIVSTNIGLDWGALHNRLTGSFDYFIRTTKNMVGPGVELPVVLGTAVPNTNNTDLEIKGWELMVSWRDNIRDFSYGVSLALSDSRRLINRYPNPTGSLNAYIEGMYTGDIFGYTTKGIAKTNEEMQAHLDNLPNGGQSALGSNWAAGDIMYVDINGDGKINSGANTIHDMGDLTLIGNSTPRYHTGITLDASWKGLDIRMFWQGVLKRDFAPQNYYMVFWGVNRGGQWNSTGLKEHLDYFRADADHPLGQNLDAYYPRPMFNSNKNAQVQTRYLQNAAYMRLKNLQVGYTFPASLLKKGFVKNLRVFASGENLWTRTKLTKTMDPETVGLREQQSATGTAYPLSTTYSFGLNVNF